MSGRNPYRQKPQSEKRKPRKCLMCSETFDSSWPGERTCKKCRSSDAWKDNGSNMSTLATSLSSAAGVKL